MKKIFVFVFFCMFFAAFAKNQKKSGLTISETDILLTNETEETFVKDGSGIHLFVRKKGDIKSIMLIRYKAERGSPKTILRAEEFNSVNGNEEFCARGKSTESFVNIKYLLIATKTEENEFLGECFHIYIPSIVIYGISQNAKPQPFSFENLKIRTFERPNCDGEGAFQDYDFGNVAEVRSFVTFSEIASKTQGTVQIVEDAKSLPDSLIKKIDSLDSKESIELVFAIDATESMKDDFDELKKNWLPQFEKQMKKFKNAKIGLLFYKDYGDDFHDGTLPVKNLGFLKDAKAFSKAFGKISVNGGGDREEAVYESLYACATNFSWSENATKKIILIGDAPPNQKKGKFNPNEIFKTFSDKNISVDCFLISESTEEPNKMKTIEKNEIPPELQKSVEELDAK
ncbi:MAG: VWA domain-containing protein [Treponema sp.]|nr:VWA domain-containing protein [Treponema sp.]